MSAARREAARLLSAIRLPPGSRRSAGEPAGAGAALASSSVSLLVVPHLVDLHRFFVVQSSTPAEVIGWLQAHRPVGSSQADSGSSAPPGGQWTSFGFLGVHGFASAPELVADAVQVAGGDVAVRVDAQIAPLARLPGSGRGPGSVRVVESSMAGSVGYELRCDPAGGTVPDAAGVCAAIRAQPALLYSFPGPDHSCPAGVPSVTLSGTWDGKPLNSNFSVCTGGQEALAGRWAQLLPSVTALLTVHVDRGIGLVRLGEPESAATDLLRGSSPAPAPCANCMRTFPAGFSVGYGDRGTQPAGWTVTFTDRAVSRITTNLDVTLAGGVVSRGFTGLRRALRSWTARTLPDGRELVHHSADAISVIVYGLGAFAFERAIVTRPMPVGRRIIGMPSTAASVRATPSTFVMVNTASQMSIYSAGTGRPVRTLASFSSQAFTNNGLAYAPDGSAVYFTLIPHARRVVSLRLMRLDTATGRRLFIAYGAQPAISNDGTQLAYGAFPRGLAVRDLATGQTRTLGLSELGQAAELMNASIGWLQNGSEVAIVPSPTPWDLVGRPPGLQWCGTSQSNPVVVFVHVPPPPAPLTADCVHLTGRALAGPGVLAGSPTSPTSVLLATSAAGDKTLVEQIAKTGAITPVLTIPNSLPVAFDPSGTHLLYLVGHSPPALSEATIANRKLIRGPWQSPVDLGAVAW